MTKVQRRKINTIKFNNIEDFKVWYIYAAILPLATYLFAIFINFIFLINRYDQANGKNLFAILNNGSLPIIAFGIVSSCIPFLMEVIEVEEEVKSVISDIRKKIMAISVLILFLTSALYIVQSINREIIFFEDYQEQIIFAVTVVLLLFSISIGGKMFLLQKNTIHKHQEYIAQKGAVKLSKGLGNKFDLDSKFD